MMETLRLIAWRYVHVTFPERQIYIRTDGRVQFYAFTPLMQAVFVGAGLAFLGWLSFASVNVIFGDRIVAANEHRFEQMRASYEGRIADLLLSYDELNGALVTAQDRFTTIVDSFEAKQQAVAELVQRKQALQGSLAKSAPILTPTVGSAAQSKGAIASAPGMGGVFDPAAAVESAAAWAPPFAAGEGPSKSLPAADAIPPDQPAVVVAPKEATPRERLNFLRNAVDKLGALFRRKAAASAIDHPILRQAALEEARIARLTTLQPQLLAEAALDMDKQAAGLARALRNTGIDSRKLLTRVTSQDAAGGRPFPRMDTSDFGSDEGFNTQMMEASSSLEKLSNLLTAIHSLPLESPVDGAGVSSGFGERQDPFNEQLAFHSGIDFSGQRGADVRATAAGVVVFAGPRGAYGNTVEIDHGYGIRTRYGHLARISVQAGARLEDGAVVGKLGSTGRSTGPHVHYEVWSDEAVRDPSKFIKAGRYVHEAQGS